MRPSKARARDCGIRQKWCCRRPGTLKVTLKEAAPRSPSIECFGFLSQDLKVEKPKFSLQTPSLLLTTSFFGIIEMQRCSLMPQQHTLDPAVPPPRTLNNPAADTLCCRHTVLQTH